MAGFTPTGNSTEAYRASGDAGDCQTGEPLRQVVKTPVQRCYSRG